jgi:hypothetical protein
VFILDNDSPPKVFVSSSNKTVDEDNGLVIVNLSLSGPSVYDVSVPLNLSGTAVQGSDYSISTTNVVIPAGATSGSFQISPIDDTQYESTEKVIVGLGYPTNAELGSPASYTLVIEDNDLPPCEVGSYLLTVGADSITLSMVNEGESVIFTGGSVSWPESSSNQPRLEQVSFTGTVVFSGSEKPTSYAYTAWEDFYTLSTESISWNFSGPLGTGQHVLVSNFQNPVSGATCSLTETFTKH